MLEHALVERHQVHALYVHVGYFLKTDRGSGRALSCEGDGVRLESLVAQFGYTLLYSDYTTVTVERSPRIKCSEMKKLSRSKLSRCILVCADLR